VGENVPGELGSGRAALEGIGGPPVAQRSAGPSGPSHGSMRGVGLGNLGAGGTARASSSSIAVQPVAVRQLLGDVPRPGAGEKAGHRRPQTELVKPVGDLALHDGTGQLTRRGITLESSRDIVGGGTGRARVGAHDHHQRRGELIGYAWSALSLIDRSPPLPAREPPAMGKLFEISRNNLGSGVKGGRRPAERTLDAGSVEALRAS
jgi:hypothetical protein